MRKLLELGRLSFTTVYISLRQYTASVLLSDACGDNDKQPNYPFNRVPVPGYFELSAREVELASLCISLLPRLA